MIDEILSKVGLKYEDLNLVEKETFTKALEAIRQSQLTPDKLKEYIISCREAVEMELSQEPEYISLFIFKVRNDKNIMLKARLRNYLLLETFLSRPERAKELLERMVSGMIAKK